MSARKGQEPSESDAAFAADMERLDWMIDNFHTYEPTQEQLAMAREALAAMERGDGGPLLGMVMEFAENPLGTEH